MKRTISLFACGLAFGFGTIALGVDPTISAGVAGHGTTSAVAGGRGFTVVGLNSPGNVASSVAGTGVTSASAGGTSRGTSDGSYPVATSGVMLSGRNGSTADSVPGRSPTYMNMVAGKNSAPGGGGIAP